MRRRMLFGGASGPTLKGTIIDKSNVVAGDICAVNADNEKFFIRVTEGSTVVEGTAIGVVVIPTSHNVYGTEECAVMSLNGMSYSTPDTGGASDQSIYWGVYQIDTSLPNLNVANTIGAAISQTDNISTTNYPYLPSDSFTGATCVKDENAKYTTTGRTNCAPSPYLTDGTRNPQYYDTSVSSLNALADFDGVGNTNVLLSLTKSQTDWQTADTITNTYSSGYTPAACCCWRYSTVGTSQGDWYLPACGELGYVCARRGVINTALRYIIDNQLVEFCSTVPTANFWSSSEYSSNFARYVGMYSGYVDDTIKSSSYYVRAFCRA